MGYGISVVNSSGISVIDQNYSNHRLLQSGTVTLINGGSSDWVSFPTQADGVIIAIGGTPPSDAYVGLRSLEANRFRLYGVRYINNGSTFSVAYRVYAKSANNSLSNETYGMRVYKDDGSLVFDSGHDSLVVKGVSIYGVNGNANGYPYWDQGSAVKFTIPRLGTYVSLNETLPICGVIVEDFSHSPQPTFVYGLRSSSIQIGIGGSYDAIQPPSGDGNFILNSYGKTNRIMLFIG